MKKNVFCLFLKKNNKAYSKQFTAQLPFPKFMLCRRYKMHCKMHCLMRKIIISFIDINKCDNARK